MGDLDAVAHLSARAVAFDITNGFRVNSGPPEDLADNRKHGGQLTIQNRRDTQGCEVIVRIPGCIVSVDLE
jgi:hypothetical protein